MGIVAETPSPESTAHLLDLARGGDDGARERLMARYLPVLRRWAHGRLPSRARSTADTNDIVQTCLVRALQHLDRFEPRREGAFLAYLRQILLNAIRDEARRLAHRVDVEPVSDATTSGDRSLLDQVIGREAMEAFEAALATLPAIQQEAIILRLELGMSHQEVADAIGSPSADAARVMVSRAIVQLAKELDEHRSGR